MIVKLIYQLWDAHTLCFIQHSIAPSAMTPQYTAGPLYLKVLHPQMGRSDYTVLQMVLSILQKDLEHSWVLVSVGRAEVLKLTSHEYWGTTVDSLGWWMDGWILSSLLTSALRVQYLSSSHLGSSSTQHNVLHRGGNKSGSYLKISYLAFP